MIVKEVHIDGFNREIMEGYGYTRECPYSNRQGTVNPVQSGTWHWHPELEFAHILTGHCVFHTPFRDIDAPADSMVFINSSVFHSVDVHPSSATCTYHTHLISRGFLAGSPGEIIDTRYFAPVLSCPELSGLAIHPDTPAHRRMIALAEAAYAQADDEEFLFELRVREKLTELWLLFVEETRPVWENSLRKNDVRNDRIRAMLSYIQENCAEKLSLESIAASAGVSQRECLRCFQALLKTTPFEYLNDCRVRRAANMLTETTASITEIALSCGFGSASYFCRIFRRFMHASPSEYKRQHAARRT